MSAQVTFELVDGSNESWYLDSWENLNAGGQWRTNPGANAYVIFKASSPTYIQGYTFTLTPTSNSDGHLPKTWTLYGSNDEGDDKEWTLIHSQQEANRMMEDFDNPDVNINNKKYAYYCNSGTQYLFYKLNVTAKDKGQWGCFQISRFDLIPSSVGFTGDNKGMDGKTTVKWEGNPTQTLNIEATASTKVVGYQFTTGNDNASYNGRNPKEWTVEGSTDGSNWTTIQTMDYSGMEDKNYYPYTFIFTDAAADNSYKFYRIKVTRAIGGGYFQLSEVALITEGAGLYRIGSAEDMGAFATDVNGGKTYAKAILTTDVDMSATSYVPVGTSSNKFRGLFDGQGHTVTLAIDNDSKNQGLFGVVQGDASIQNVIVAGSVTANSKVAGLIGMADGGGIITLSKVINTANIQSTGSSDANAAALVGCAINNTVVMATNCGNTGSVSGQNGQCAAFTGWAQNNGDTKTTYTNCWNSGVINNMESNCNLYRNTGAVVVDNCYDASGNNSYTQGTLLGVSAVTDGELCYKLGSAFTQNLGAANYPTFGSKTVTAGKWFNTSVNDVYYNLEGGNYTVYQLNLGEASTTYDVPANVTAKNVKISRNIAAGKWNTFCSPVALSKSSFSEVKEFTGASNSGGNYTLTFDDEDGDIEAGKPYMVKVSDDITELTATDVTVTAAPTPVTCDGVTFEGVYANANAPIDSYIISNNAFYHVDSTVALKAFRGYFTISGANVKELNYIMEGDDATAIKSLTPALSEGEGAIYNIAGQRLSKMQKGINIINGRKVLF